MIPTIVFLSFQLLVSLGFVLILILKLCTRKSSHAAVKKHTMIGITWLLLLQLSLAVTASLFVIALIDHFDGGRGDIA